MIVYDTLQPTLAALVKVTNSEPTDSLMKQKDFLQSFINTKHKMANWYPNFDKEESINTSNLTKHKAFDNVMPKSDWSFKYQFKMKKIIEHTEHKRSLPFVSILDNEDEKVLIIAFSSKIEIRLLSNDWILSFIQYWSFNEKELITAFDTKRKDQQIYFVAGTLNGIIYIVEFPSMERIIFDNHSDIITWVKFNPIQTKDLLLSWSKDWSIRMFDIYNEAQIAIYQDPYNCWLSVKNISWHDSSEKFISVWDRNGQDLIHFWYNPDHKFQHKLEGILGAKAEEAKNKHLLSNSDFDDSDKYDFQIQSKNENLTNDVTNNKNNLCFSFYRSYRNISNEAVLQVEFFGEAYFLATYCVIYLIWPLNEKEFQEVRKYILPSDFLQLKIIDEYLIINTREEILFVNLWESIWSNEIIVSEYSTTLKKHSQVF